MANLEVIELYGSPFSERLRWALKHKNVAYARRPFVPIAGEAEHRRATGIPTAPVLLADGKVVGDSNRALEWLEQTVAKPPLVPAEPSQRAIASRAGLIAPHRARSIIWST